MRPDGSVLIQDELATADERTTIRWAFLTEADADVSEPGGARLTRDGKRISVHVLTHRDVATRTFPTSPVRSFDCENPGTRLVGFELSLEPRTTARIAVLFMPESSLAAVTPALEPLSTW